VGNDGTENTSPVTSKEGNHQLGVLRVRFTGCCENVSIESSDCLFKGDELNNGVGDLSAPKGGNSLVESSPAFSFHNLGPSFTESLGECASIGGLDSDFNLNVRVNINNILLLANR